MTRLGLAAFLFVPPVLTMAQEVEIRVGSKKFTESVILGEAATQVARDQGIQARHVQSIGSTRVLFEALKKGEIHLYPEYTGTLIQEIYIKKRIQSPADLRAALAEDGLAMTASLGFNNTYAIGVTRKRSEQLKLRTISDLRKHPELKAGFSSEFIDRADGWPALKKRYRLPHTQINGMDHEIAYRGLIADSIQFIDLYSTDPEIPYYDLITLKDDLQHFPRYEAIYLFRNDLATTHPEWINALKKLEGTLNDTRMAALNAETTLTKVPEKLVAARLLSDSLGIHGDVQIETLRARITRRTLEHLVLVGVSLAAALLIGIPLGVLAFRNETMGHVVLSSTGVLQTIPSLALMVLLIPLFGIGTFPAIIMLFLYGLLPIVRNTHAGLYSISSGLRESAEVLGLSRAYRLRRIEIPLALPSILAGVKTAAVINVGTATLGALIGAGGLGQPILTGIRMNDFTLILGGAIPAALLALIAQYGFELLEKRVVPRGLRTRRP